MGGCKTDGGVIEESHAENNREDVAKYTSIVFCGVFMRGDNCGSGSRMGV